MIRLIFTIIVVPVFVGCSKSSTAPTGPATPAGLPGYVRPDDSTISAEHTKAIAIAKTHLEETYPEAVDAYFRVTETNDGFSVHVKYVYGYDDAGQPWFIAGGHCAVLVLKEWKVVKILFLARSPNKALGTGCHAHACVSMFGGEFGPSAVIAEQRMLHVSHAHARVGMAPRSRRSSRTRIRAN